MKKKDILQMVKFGTVGALNTVFDYAVFYLFFAVCNLDKNLAQILATSLAMVNSYVFNRYWTFERRGRAQGREILRFLVVNCLALGTTLLCLNLFHDVFYLHEIANRILLYFGSDFMLVGDNGVLFCKVLAMPFSLCVNFFGNRCWVFSSTNS